MVLNNTAKSESEFSIERLESEMLSAKITYKQINKELGYDVEKMLKDKRRKPMLNVIGKVCTCIGLKNTDYVMMKTDQPEYEKIKPKYSNKEDKYISTSIIYHELLDLYIKESRWSYETISTLMHSRSILRKGVSYLKQTQKISKDDINTLCYALSCKISDICDIKGESTEAIPPRALNKRQIYLLNSKFINELPQITKVCEHAKVPEWFICNNKKVYVSAEMLDIICNSINQVTGKIVTYGEVCDCIALNKNKKVEEKEKMAIAGTSIKTTESKMEVTKNNTECENITNKENNKTEDYLRTGNKHNYKNNNDKRRSSSNNLKSIFNAIDNTLDEDLNKILEYVNASKRLRELKNSLLE